MTYEELDALLDRVAHGDLYISLVDAVQRINAAYDEGALSQTEWQVLKSRADRIASGTK